MADENKVPGVTLFLQNTREYKIADRNKAVIMLECEIADQETWKGVVQILQSPGGYRIYTQDDFKGELVTVFKGEVQRLEAAALSMNYENRMLKEQLAAAEEQLAYYKGVFDGLNKQLKG